MARAMRMYRERCGRSISEYDPELFALPFHSTAWSKVETVDFLVPTDQVIKISSAHPNDPRFGVTYKAAERIARCERQISSGTEFVRWKCDSHPFDEVDPTVGERTFKSVFSSFVICPRNFLVLVVLTTQSLKFIVGGPNSS